MPKQLVNAMQVLITEEKSEAIYTPSAWFNEVRYNHFKFNIKNSAKRIKKRVAKWSTVIDTNKKQTKINLEEINQLFCRIQMGILW